LDDPLIYVRAVHFAATLTVAGLAFFVPLIANPAFRDAGKDARVAPAVRFRLGWVMWVALALAVLSGAAWLMLNAQTMSGSTWDDLWSTDVVGTVLLQTTFGRDWLARVVLACLLAGAFALLSPSEERQPIWLKAALLTLGAAFAGTLAWAGHGAGGLGVESFVHPAADVLHLVAAAAWVGMLLPLLLLLTAVGRDPASLAMARSATVRFSTLGVVSVATLLLTGSVNTWYLAGSVPALTETNYGRLLLVKIALFLGMVAVAAFNRLSLTPRLVRGASEGRTHNVLFHLRRNVVVEVLLGAMIIVIVAMLGTTPPGLHQMAAPPAAEVSHHSH
jgi:copper resistance protein D